MKEIDARGRPCPQPVLMTKRAVDAGESAIKVIVDNEGAVQNVTRFAEKEGYAVKVTPSGSDFELVLTREGAAPAQAQPAAQAEVTCETGSWKINRGQVLFLNSEKVGAGSDELGGILIQGLMNTLAENEAVPEKIVFVNSGVKLVCEGSPVLEALQSLENKGVELLACGTCINYFGLEKSVRAGKVSNAYEILNALLEAQRLVSF